MSAWDMAALLLLLIGASTLVAHVTTARPVLAPVDESGTDTRPCGPCGTDTAHWVTATGSGLCTGCRAENPRTYTAA